MKKLLVIFIIITGLLVSSCKDNEKSKNSDLCKDFLKTDNDHKGRLITYARYILKSTENIDETLVIYAFNPKSSSNINKTTIGFQVIGDSRISNVNLLYKGGMKETIQHPNNIDGYIFYEINKNDSKVNLLIKTLDSVQVKKNNGKLVDFHFTMMDSEFFKHSLNCLYKKLGD